MLYSTSSRCVFTIQITRKLPGMTVWLFGMHCLCLRWRWCLQFPVLVYWQRPVNSILNHIKLIKTTLLSWWSPSLCVNLPISMQCSWKTACLEIIQLRKIGYKCYLSYCHLWFSCLWRGQKIALVVLIGTRHATVAINIQILWSLLQVSVSLKL